MGSVSIPIPPVSYETHHWVPQVAELVGRRRLAAATGDYESAVTGRIAGYAPVLPPEVAADVEEAAAALSRFDSYALSRLGVDNPTLGPMSAVLLRTESTSSSQIEHLTASARQLALAELGEARSPNAEIVVGNVRAMEAALALADTLDESAILAMHRVLLEHQRGWQDQAGRYRDQLVWIGSSGLGPLGASYVAPQPGLVPAAMADLVAFLNRIDLPVLVLAAVSHAQFETIHPFADGNGRTGRAVVHAILKHFGLVTHTTAPVSAGLLTTMEAYVSALDAYRDGDARPIIEAFCAASVFAAGSGTHLVDTLAIAIESIRDRLTGLRPQAVAWQVVPHLIAHPAITTHLLTETLNMAASSAANVVETLAGAGVLVERTGNRRNRVWEQPDILSILDDYAASLYRP